MKDPFVAGMATFPSNSGLVKSKTELGRVSGLYSSVLYTRTRFLPEKPTHVPAAEWFCSSTNERTSSSIVPSNPFDSKYPTGPGERERKTSACVLSPSSLRRRAKSVY